jgi:hypothetical protein
VGWLYIGLLALAVIVVIGAEWPRLAARFGLESRRRRERAKRKASLRLLRTESDEFAASRASARSGNAAELLSREHQAMQGRRERP